MKRAGQIRFRHWPLRYTWIGYHRSMVLRQLYCPISWITSVPSGICRRSLNLPLTPDSFQMPLDCESFRKQIVVVVLWECGKLCYSFPYFHSQVMLSVIMPQTKQANSRATAVFAMLCFDRNAILLYLRFNRSFALSA